MKASTADQTLQTFRVQGWWRLSKKQLDSYQIKCDRMCSAQLAMSPHTSAECSNFCAVQYLKFPATSLCSCWPICPIPADVSSFIPAFRLALAVLHPSINLTEKQLFFFLVRFGPRLAVYHSTLVGRGSFDNPIIICCMMPFRYSFRFMGPSRLPDIQPQTAFVPVGASCVSVSKKQKKQGQDKYVPPAEDTLVGTGEAGRRLHAPVGLNTIKSVLVAASSSPQHWLKRPRKNTFNVIHAFSFSKRLMLDWKE